MAQDWQAYLDAIPDDLLSVDEKFQAEAHILHTIANVEDRIRLFRGEHAMQAGRIKALLPSAGARAAAASPGWWPLRVGALMGKADFCLNLVQACSRLLNSRISSP